MNNDNGVQQTRAVDLPEGRRPGVPARAEPRPVGSAHWLTPEHQVSASDVTMDAQREEPTATFGTGQPPRGLSGVMRRAAYRIPDYEARRWALLLAADRVDALEDRAKELATNPVTWVVLAAGTGLATAGVLQLRRMRRRTLWERLFR